MLEHLVSEGNGSLTKHSLAFPDNILMSLYETGASILIGANAIPCPSFVCPDAEFSAIEPKCDVALTPVQSSAIPQRQRSIRQSLTLPEIEVLAACPHLHGKEPVQPVHFQQC